MSSINQSLMVEFFSHVLCYFTTVTFSYVILCSKSTKSDIPKEKGKKAPRVWELGGCANKEVLDYSTPTTNGTPEAALSEDINLVRCIKVRVKVTISQKLGRKQRIYLDLGNYIWNYIWSFSKAQILMLTRVYPGLFPSAIGFPDHFVCLFSRFEELGLGDSFKIWIAAVQMMKGPLKTPNLGRRVSGGRWCGCRIDDSCLLPASLTRFCDLL